MQIIQDKKTGAYLADVHLSQQFVVLAETADRALQFPEQTAHDCAATLRKFYSRYDWQVVPCQ